MLDDDDAGVLDALDVLDEEAVSVFGLSLLAVSDLPSAALLSLDLASDFFAPPEPLPLKSVTYQPPPLS